MLAQTLRPAAEVVVHYPESDRRAVVRYLCDREVAYSPLVIHERLWARVRNVSVNGIGLVVGSPLEPGTELVVEIKTINPGISLSLVARVVHATMQEDESWLVGCKFVTKPTEEQVLALL